MHVIVSSGTKILFRSKNRTFLSSYMNQKER